jgi:hypothetical protein
LVASVLVDVLGIGDPRRGHHVDVQFAGFRPQDAKPARISDDQGRAWTVEDITDHWVHPDRHHSGADKVGYGIEAERWRLVVDGPLPYERGRGRQPVTIVAYNDGAGWYLRPGGENTGGEGRPGDVSQTS